MIGNYSVLVIMIVEHESTPSRPYIAKQRIMNVQSSYGVSSQDSQGLPASKAKIVLKVICSHFSISNCIGMMFRFCGFVWLVTKIHAVPSSCVKLESSLQIDLANVGVFSLMTLRIWIAIVSTIANHIIGFNSKFNCCDGSQGPQICSRFAR